MGRLFYGNLDSGEIFEFNYDTLGLDFEGMAILNIGQDVNGELYIATSVASTAQQAPSDPNGGAVLRLLPVGSSCDFDFDGVCNITDLNALLSLGPVAAGVPAAGNELFDLTGDDLIDNEDVDAWLAIAGADSGLTSPYRRGDANLDGVVDTSDFNLWNANKFNTTLLWDSGNFNGDDVTDTSDFNIWNANKFRSSDRVTFVPESGTGTLSCILAMFLLRFTGFPWRRATSTKITLFTSPTAPPSRSK